MTSASKVIELYYTRPTIVNRYGCRATGERLEGDIRFEDVSLSLAGHPLLKHINLHIKPGETVAVMGNLSLIHIFLQDYYDSHPELKEYEIIEFCDDGYTGTNFDRPRFMAMMELARQKEIHAIIVKDLSRFGRDYLEVGAYLESVSYTHLDVYKRQFQYRSGRRMPC